MWKKDETCSICPQRAELGEMREAKLQRGKPSLDIEKSSLTVRTTGPNVGPMGGSERWHIPLFQKASQDAAQQSLVKYSMVEIPFMDELD